MRGETLKLAGHEAVLGVLSERGVRDGAWAEREGDRTIRSGLSGARTALAVLAVLIVACRGQWAATIRAMSRQQADTQALETR